MVAADTFESGPSSGQRSFVGDLVSRERDAIRAGRECRLRCVGREHYHNVVAGIDERTEWPMEERDAVKRFDQLRTAKASGGAARKKDP
jgi:hypothetical protein